MYGVDGAHVGRCGQVWLKDQFPRSKTAYTSIYRVFGNILQGEISQPFVDNCLSSTILLDTVMHMQALLLVGRVC